VTENDGGRSGGSIVLALHAHVPRILRCYRTFDRQAEYFDVYRTRHHCRNYVEQCVLPTNRVLLAAIDRLGDQFRFSISISGIAADLFELHAPEAIDSFRELVMTGCVEVLATPYDQGFAFAYSMQAFAGEIVRHRDRMTDLFDTAPRVFRNTELICGDQVANTAAHLGFDAILSDAPNQALAGRSCQRVYTCGHSNLPMILRDPQLACAVSESFDGSGPSGAILTAPEFAARLANVSHNAVAGLFWNYQTFGSRFVTQSGIFDFLRHLPDLVVARGAVGFATPSQVVANGGRMDELKLGQYVSPAEWGGGLSPWLGGSMQSHAAHQLFALEGVMGDPANSVAFRDWQCLHAADYLLAMSMHDRAVAESARLIPHLDGPYHAYIVFMNILDDLKRRSVGQARDPQPDASRVSRTTG